MLKRTIGIFVVSAIVSAGVLVAGSASAWTQRRAGGACNGGSASNWGISGNNTSTSFALVLGCAIDSDDDRPHAAITHLNVHVDNPGSLSIANRCVRFFNVSGGNCGNGSSSSNVGTITLTPPNAPATFASHWNAGVHFPSVAVTLTPSGALKGFYTDNL